MMTEDTDNLEYKSLEDRERDRSEIKRRYNKSAKRTSFEREMDLVDEARWYLQGYTMVEIARMISETREYGITKQSVQNDFKVIRKRWLERYLLDYDKAKSQELAKIDQLEIAYWEAWEISKGAKESTEAVQSDDPRIAKGTGKQNAGKRTKITKKKETRDPNAVYLQGIERCIDKRMRILGLDAPKTVNVNWRKEAVEAGLDPDKMKNDLVNQFIDAAASPRDDEESREQSD